MVCARRHEDRPDRKTPSLALVTDEPEERRRLARGSDAEAVADHQPQVVSRDLDQIALLDVPGTAQPGAAQAADVEDEGEAALDLLRPQAESLMGNCALQPRPVVVDRPTSRVVTLPAGESLPCIRVRL